MTTKHHGDVTEFYLVIVAQFCHRTLITDSQISQYVCTNIPKCILDPNPNCFYRCIARPFDWLSRKIILRGKSCPIIFSEPRASHNIWLVCGVFSQRDVSFLIYLELRLSNRTHRRCFPNFSGRNPSIGKPYSIISTSTYRHRYYLQIVHFISNVVYNIIIFYRTNQELTEKCHKTEGKFTDTFIWENVHFDSVGIIWSSNKICLYGRQTKLSTLSKKSNITSGWTWTAKKLWHLENNKILEKLWCSVKTKLSLNEN